MNFYKELERECKAAGLDVEVIPVPDELIPTPEDYAELDRNVWIRTEANREMLQLSEQYASESMPVGKQLDRIRIEDIEFLIGNLLASRNGKCITYRQFYEFYNKVEARDGGSYIVSRTYPLEDYFDDFGKRYSFLAVKSDVNKIVFSVIFLWLTYKCSRYI